MNLLYSSLQATASRLLRQYGRTMTLRHLTSGSYVLGTAVVKKMEETVVGVTSAFSDYAIANELVGVNDLRLTIAAQGVTAPNVSDEIDADGVTYKIIRVSPLNPAGTPLLYELQVRS